MPNRSTASAASALALLAAADGLFLWMFFATDPLEQFAARARQSRASLAADALAFAASWRHGMAGNSWIYMPGFFATAAAIWLHSRRVMRRAALTGRAFAAVAGLLVALAAAPAGSTAVIRGFSEVSGVQVVVATAHATPAAVFNGVYTLLTWSAFVVACRAALSRRTLRPFAAPAVLTVGLAVVRPWTVDDFVDYWAAGIVSGSGSALASFALIFIVAGLLVACERTSTQPQPREAVLNDRNAPRGKDEQEIGADRKQIEPR